MSKVFNILNKYIRQFIFFGILCLPILSYNQTPKIDSLKQTLINAPNDSLRSDLNEQLAYCYLYFKPDSALAYIDKAYQIAEQNDYKKGIAKAISRKGTFYIVKSQYPEAIIELQKSLTLYKELNDKMGLSETYGNLGVLDFYLRDYDSAKENFYKAITYIDTVSQVENYTKYITNLSGIHRKEDNLDSAVFYGKKSLDNAKKYASDNRIASVAFFNLGTAQFYLNEYENTLKNLDSALAIPSIPVQFEILSKSYKAKSFVELNNLDAAEKELNGLEERAIEIGDQFILLSYYESKQKLLEALGNASGALVYANRSLELNKEVHSREQTNILQNLKVKFENEERDLENELLRSDAEIQAMQIENQRYTIWVVAVFIFLLLLMILILYRMYNLKAKNNTILKEKQSVLNEFNRNLTTINSEKNKLFSIVAHDVKSPVAAILSSASILQTNLDSFTSEELKNLASELKSQSSNLHYLLENVLIWAKSQMDGFRFVAKEIKLKPFIQDLYENELVFIKRKNITITCDITTDVVLKTDPQVLQVILRNLLNNAIKFTSAGGEITFKSEKTNHFYYIHITDNGIGMAQDKMNKVLINRERYTVKGTANETGNGIGLILCQEIAKKAGGEITAKSSLGEGSTFTLILPVLETDLFQE